MKLIDKILRFFGLKKKEPIVQKEDQVNYDEMKKFNDEEPIEQDEKLDDINKEIIKNIPPINIVPIPTIKKDAVDLEQFNKEVKKYEEEQKEEQIVELTENGITEEVKEIKKPAHKKKSAPKKKQVEKPIEKVEEKVKENVEEKKEVQSKKKRQRK